MGHGRLSKHAPPPPPEPTINVLVLCGDEHYVFQGRKEDASALMTAAVTFAHNPELNFTDEAAAKACDKIRKAAAA